MAEAEPDTIFVELPPVAADRSPIARIWANVAHLVGGKAMAGLVSLVYLVIVSRTLGSEGFGVLVLVNAYAVLIGSLVAFSGFHGVVRYGAIALERGDRAALAQILRFMALIELGCGAVAVLVAAALVPWVGPHFGWTPAETRFAALYSLAVLATVRATPQGLLQLARRFDLVALHQIVAPMVRLIGALIAWFAHAGVIGFLVAWLVAALAEGAAMWLFAIPAWRELLAGHPLRGAWRTAARDNEGFARFILSTNLDITLREVAPYAVPLTIGWMLGPAAAGVFALAQRATSVLQQPAILLSQGSYSVLAELAARGNRSGLDHAVWRSVLFTTAAAVAILAALALIGGKLLVWIGGGSFAGGTYLLMLVALSRAIGLAASPFGAALTAMGRPDRSVAAALVANVALYPLLPLLLLWTGPAGAGWHALVQNAAAAGLLAMFFARVEKGGQCTSRS
jgi:O-antigen/teichoic acid export membrane protein